MNERTFLKQVAEDDETRVRLEAQVTSILSDYARSEEIPLNELSENDIHNLATGLVARGLGE